MKRLFLELYCSPLWWPLLFLVSFDAGALCGRVL